MLGKKATDIIAYLSWPGILIAFLLGDRYGGRFHLNQSLVIWLVGTICGFMYKVPWVGGIISGVGGLLCSLCWFMGIICAIIGSDRPVPLLGRIHLL